VINSKGDSGLLLLLEKFDNISTRNYAIIITAVIQVYFVYIWVYAFQKAELPDSPLPWLMILAKIGLAYVTYKLFIYKDGKLLALGCLLPVIVVITTYGFYFTSPEKISPIVGGFVTMFVFINLFFLYRYIKIPDAIKWTYGKNHKVWLALLILAIMVYGLLRIESGLPIISSMFVCLTFHAQNKISNLPRKNSA